MGKFERIFKLDQGVLLLEYDFINIYINIYNS